MFDPSLIHGTHWLADPDYLKLAVARLRMIPTCPSARDIALYRRERIEEFRQMAGSSTPIRAGKGKVGVIPVHGPIDQRQSSQLMKLGGTSTEEVGIALDMMVADKAIESIVLHVDSPGGGVYGVQELSDKLFNARQSKRIYAHADSMAASAAYWIASSASPGSFVVTPGGDVGSVGVYSIHVDQSRALEAQGYTVTVAKAGKFKAEFMDVAPLTEEAKGFQQSMVDETYGRFLNALRRNRNTTVDDVRRNYGEGRVVSADEAKSKGMVDRIMPWDELIGKLTGGSSDQRRAEADVLRRAHERRLLVAP